MTGLVAIVVNYQSGDRLRSCLSSLLSQQPPPDRVLVVDNDSRDDSAQRLPPGVDLLRSGRNGGFGDAVNQGLAASREACVLTLNPDTELLPGCLAAAMAVMAREPLAGSVALRALQAADPRRLDASGIGLTSHCGQINWDHGLLESELGTESHPVLGPLGGAALWRRQALERAGGFATHFFLYWEDVDMALRLDRAGYTCLTAPAARILHQGSASTGHWSALNVFQMLANHWPCLLGALPGRVLSRHPLALLLAPLRAALLYARRGRPFTATAGLAWGALRAPAALWRRRQLTRSGSGRKAAERVEMLMAAADRNRLAMKARAPALRPRAPS